MITKFKLYEAINQGEPEIGDYVLCEFPSNGFYDTELRKYINITNIGHIVYIAESSLCLVQFDYLPKKYSTIGLPGQRYISSIYIKYWAKSKEELEEFLTTKKYNL